MVIEYFITSVKISIPIQLHHALFSAEMDANESNSNGTMISFIPITNTFAPLKELSLTELSVSDPLMSISNFIDSSLSLRIQCAIKELQSIVNDSFIES